MPEIEIGTGVLGWDAYERRSDRYGQVILFTSPDVGCEKRVELIKVETHDTGQLIAVVKETRKSNHIGDLFHGVYPETPEVGQRIVLGEGILISHKHAVGIKPLEKRSTWWLDIRALYRVHHQTVTLFFVSN